MVAETNTQTTVAFTGDKLTDLASQKDFFDAALQDANQSAGAYEFMTAHQLQTGSSFKTYPVKQLNAGATVNILNLSVFNPSQATGITLDLMVSRKQQGNPTRSMKYLITVARSAAGAIVITAEDYGGDRADYYTGLLFPADPLNLLDITSVVNGSNVEYAIDLAQFNSGSGDASEAYTEVRGRVEYMNYVETISNQRTNMKLLIDND